jgi:hypothetical protein
MATPAEPRVFRFDRRLVATIVAVGACGSVLTVAALAFFSLHAAISAAAGALLAVGNLWVLALIVSALLPADDATAKTQSRKGWGLLAAVKMLALLALTWLLMRHGLVSPMPMLVGFLSLPSGIAIGSLVSDDGDESAAG